MACPDPGKDCPLCPRLVEFRAKNRAQFPGKWNAPVPSFGPENGQLLVVGLAPGLKGANFTGRPFTADYAGDLLYATLLKYGFASGIYDERADDGLVLKNCRITNAVRCVPPENKPTPAEMKQCLGFLQMEMVELKNVRVILSLGLISHNSVLKALSHKISKFKFAHGAVHELGKVKLIDSYHCSRYNTNTGRLTTPMFESVFDKITDLLRQPAG